MIQLKSFQQCITKTRNQRVVNYSFDPKVCTVSVATHVKLLKNPSDLKRQVTENPGKSHFSQSERPGAAKSAIVGNSWSTNSLGTMPSTDCASPGESY